MALNFPVWWVVLFVALQYWPVTLLIALGLGVLGYVLRGWWRAAAWVAAGGLGVVLLVGTFLLLQRHAKDKDSEAEQDRWEKAHHVLLTQPWEGMGLTLPVGTEVYWTANEKQDFIYAVLQAETMEFGAPLQGEIRHQSMAFYGTLARTALVSGWWCAQGNVQLSEQGTLVRCTTARDGRIGRQLVPAGSALSLGTAGNNESYFTLPADRPLALEDGSGLSVKGGDMVYVNAQGAVISLSSYGDMIVRGLPLRMQIKFLYAGDADESDAAPRGKPYGVQGELAQDVNCDGHSLKMGSQIKLKFTGDAAWVTPFSVDGGEQPELELHCLR